MARLFTEYPKMKRIYKQLLNRANYQGLIIINFNDLKKAANCSKHYIKKSLKLLTASNYLQIHDKHNHAYYVTQLRKEFNKAEGLLSPHAIIHLKKKYKRKIRFLKNNNQYLRESNKHWVKIVKRSNKDNQVALDVIDHKKPKPNNMAKLSVPTLAEDQKGETKIRQKYLKKQHQIQNKVANQVYTSKDNLLAQTDHPASNGVKVTVANTAGNQINHLTQESNQKVKHASQHRSMASASSAQPADSNNKSASNHSAKRAKSSSQPVAKQSKVTKRTAQNQPQKTNNDMFTL